MVGCNASDRPLPATDMCQKNEECVAELGAFARGGCAGVHRLNQVAPHVFAHYGVASLNLQVRLAFRAGLSVSSAHGKLCFLVEESDD